MSYELEQTGGLTRIAFQANPSCAKTVATLPGDMTEYDFAALASRSQASPFAGLVLKGRGNRAHIGAGSDVSGLQITVKGHQNRLIIGSNCLLKGAIGIQGHRRVVFIGAHTTFNNVAIICKHVGHVHIGRDCMFSSHIEVRTSDSHSVIDTETLAVVNLPEGVFIGDHVWVGKRAVISKGSVIAEDNIVGMSALVRGRFDESRTIIAGIPAKVVRSGRSWRREELVQPTREMLLAWKTLPLL